MIEMTESIQNACYAQGSLFLNAEKQGIDLKSFAEQFLSSNFCERDVDDYYGRFHQELFLKVVLGATDEIVKSPKTEAHPTAEQIGYMYRLLCEVTHIPSKELIVQIPFDTMEEYCTELDELTYKQLCENIIHDLSFTIQLETR